MRKNLILFTACLFFLNGCANQKLPHDYPREKLDVALVTIDNPIRYMKRNSGPITSSGNLLADLIVITAISAIHAADSVNTAEQAQKVSQIIENTDTKDNIQSLIKTVKQLPWLKINKQAEAESAKSRIVTYNNIETFAAEMSKKLKQSRIAILESNYTFSPGFWEFQQQTVFGIYDVKDGKATRIFGNQFISLYKVPADYHPDLETGERWAYDKGHLIKAALKNTTTEIIGEMQEDLATPYAQ